MIEGKIRKGGQNLTSQIKKRPAPPAPFRPNPPPEYRFAEAFQSLTMRYLGALDDVKAMRREIDALKDRVKTLEEETKP
jgi:hypothetical protein